MIKGSVKNLSLICILFLLRRDNCNNKLIEAGSGSSLTGHPILIAFTVLTAKWIDFAKSF